MSSANSVRLPIYRSTLAADQQGPNCCQFGYWSATKAVAPIEHSVGMIQIGGGFLKHASPESHGKTEDHRPASARHQL